MSMTKKISSLSTAVLTSAIMFSNICLAQDAADAKEAPVAKEAKAKEASDVGEIGAAAASIKDLTYIKGEPVSFEKGKVYVVEFWATWCGPCKVTIPHLTKLQKKYKDKGLTIIGISNENDAEKVKSFVEKKGDEMDYTVALDPKRVSGKAYMRAYKQTGIPAAFIVDQAGKIVWVGHPATIDKALDEVIAGTFDVEAYKKQKAEADAKRAEYKKLQKLLLPYNKALRAGKGIDETRPLAEKIIATKNAQALSTLAIMITMTPGVKPANRDMETATKAINAAYATLEEGDNDWNLINAYGMVMSKTGEIDKAIAVTEKAVTQSADDARVNAYFKKILERYKKQKADEEKAEEKPEATEEKAE